MPPKKKTVTKEQAAEGKIIINNTPVILRPADRSNKDIGAFRTALQSAEFTINPNRTRLYDLYATVILDGHLTGIIDKRIANVLNKSLYFEKNEEKVEEFDELVKGKKFRDLVKQLMFQKMYGLCGFEFIPGKQFDFNVIPIKHIKVELGIITEEQNSFTGFPYEDIWNIWVIGERNEFGLLLKCSPYVLWKKGNMGDWAQYIEIFGQPLVDITYEVYNEKIAQELTDVIQNMGSASRIMRPAGTNLNVLDGKTSNGTGDLQDKFRIACNDEMSIIILGATETTASSKSSGFAQASEHGKQQDEIIKCDMADIINQLNSEKFLSILQSYGYPVDGGYFCYEKEPDIDQLNQRMQVDVALAKVIPIDDDYFYSTYGIPKPENYDELKKKMDEQKQNPFGLPGTPPNNDPNSPPPSEGDGGGQQAQAKWYHAFGKWISAFFVEAR